MNGLNAGRVFGLLLLSAATAAAFYARTALSPLQEAMCFDLGLTDNQIALLQGPAVVLPAVLITIPLALLIDRFSRARLLLTFAVLNVCGTLMVASADSWSMLLAGRLLITISVMTTWPTAWALLADLFPPSQRGRAASVMTIGTILGISGSFALGGVLLELQGNDPDGWRVALHWMNAPLVVVVLLLMTLREPPRTGIRAARPCLRDVWAEMWRSRSTVAAVMGGLLVVDIAVGAVVIWGAPALSRSYGMSPAEVGGTMAMVMLISGAAGPVLGGFIADFCQRRGGPALTMLALCGLALITIPAGLFPVMPLAIAGVVTLVVFKAINQAINVISSTLATVVLPNEIRGFTLVVMQAAVALVSGGIAPVTVSGLTGLLGGPSRLGESVAIVCAASALFAAIGFLAGRRVFQQAEGNYR